MGSKSRKLAKPQQRQSPRRFGFLIYSLLVLAILGVAGYLLFTAFVRTPLPEMAGNVIDVAANMGGFDQREIRVRVGEPVTIRLRSLDNQYHTDGGGQHQWAVDELNVNLVAQPLSTNIVTFTPTEPGEYPFYCDICCGGRANPSMQGTLVVEV